jgi:fibronectin-binding autotransporter adhesin
MSKNPPHSCVRLAWRMVAILAPALLTPAFAVAQTTHVSTEAGLVAALASPGTVVFDANITLTGNLPGIDLPGYTIDGNGFTLSGDSQFRGLTIGSGGNASATIQNLTIQDTVATGGAGSAGAGGGGGGAGLGGALFIGNQGTVTVDNVRLLSSRAVGGTGGTGTAVGNGGAGGGVLGGGGGAGGTSGTPGAAGGYAGGGGGGGAGAPGAGGGVGGFGGGGGGATNATTAAGGFGGGAGADSTTGNGGGGAGLGGAIFVEVGGTLHINGAFTVNGGSVSGGAAGAGATVGSAFGSGLFLDDTGSLTVTTDSTATIADAIADGQGSGGAGSWSLVKDGTGTLVLGGNNTYSGGTDVNSGTLSVSSDANLGLSSGSLTVYDGATLQITGSGTFARGLGLGGGVGTVSVTSGQTATWSGQLTEESSATLQVRGGGTLELTNAANSYSLGTLVNGNSELVVSADGALGGGSVSLGDGASGGTLGFNALSLASSRAVTLGAGGGTIDAIGQTDATLSGVVSGTGSLTKSGTGTLTLSGQNTYSGATSVTAGLLRAGSGAAFGQSRALSVGASGTVDFNGYDQTFFTVAGSGAVALNGGARLTVGGDGSSSTFAGTISGSGGLVKDGGGTLTLAGSNTFGGGISLTAGALHVSSDVNLGGGGALAMSDATTLGITGGGTYAHSLLLAGTPSVNVSAGQSVTWSGQIGNVSSAGTLRLTGGGTFSPTNTSNSYSGGTVVTGGGTLSIGADAVLGAAGTGVTLGDAASTATLAMTAPGAFLTSRPITLGALGGTVAASSGTAATLGGAISGAGALRLSGGGSFSLTNTANSYSGGTVVAGGSTLNVGAAEVLGVAGTSLTLGDATTTGTLALTTQGTFQFLRPITLGAFGGAVNVGSGSTATLGSAISGAGAFWLTGSGTFSLTNAANSYSGGTVVTGGSTLSVGLDAVLGAAGAGVTLGDQTSAATLTLTTPGSFQSSRSITLGGLGGTIGAGSGTTATLGGAISGAGPFRLNGGGTFSLTNAANSYSGGTVVTGGSTLSIGADAVLGAPGAGLTLGDTTSGATLAITAPGAFASSRPIGLGALGATFLVGGGTAATLGGAISGAGGVTKTGGGSLMLAGANTYTGPTTVLGGLLTTGRANVFGQSAVLSVASGAAVDLNGFDQTIGSLAGTGVLTLGGGAALTLGGDNSNTLFPGSIGGTGRIVKNGSGLLTLAGANTFTGGLALNGGTLLGNTDSLRGNIVNNALVVFDQSANGTYAGSMSGTGSLTKNGAGALTLAAVNSYTGGTFLNSGSLIGNSSSLQGSVLDKAELIFNQVLNGTFRGLITGSGALTKLGSGTLTLSGTNGYTGLTTVGEGTLIVDGGLPGSVVVGPGATFQGAGVVGGSVNLGGGALFVPTPGSQQATFTSSAFAALGALSANQVPALFINGNLTATEGSTLRLSLSPGGAAPLVVSGRVTLNGTHLTIGVDDPNPARVSTYLAVAADGGLSLTGSDVSSPSPELVPVLKGDPTALMVTVLNLNVPLANIATSLGGASAARGLDQVKTTTNQDLAFVIREVTALDDAQLDDALRNLAGEIHASQQRVTALEGQMMTDLITNTLSTQEHESEDNPATQGRTQPPQFWVELAADHASFAGGTANTGGGTGGLDFKPASNVVMGGGFGLGIGQLSLSEVSGSGKLVAPRAFGYTGVGVGPFHLHLGGSACKSTTKTNRNVQFQATVPDENGNPVPLSEGVDRNAASDQSGTCRDAWTEWQDTIKIRQWTLDSKIAFRAAHYSRKPFVESGADAISLAVEADQLKVRETNLDFHLFRRTGAWRPDIRTTYRRELATPTTQADVAFAGDPASQFAVQGLPMPVNSFLGNFALTMRTASGLQYTLEYKMHLAPGETHNGLSFRMRFR